MGLLREMRVVFAHGRGRDNSESPDTDEGQKHVCFGMETGIWCGPESPGFRRGLLVSGSTAPNRSRHRYGWTIESSPCGNGLPRYGIEARSGSDGTPVMKTSPVATHIRLTAWKPIDIETGIWCGPESPGFRRGLLFT